MKHEVDRYFCDACIICFALEFFIHLGIYSSNNTYNMFVCYGFRTYPLGSCISVISPSYAFILTGICRKRNATARGNPEGTYKSYMSFKIKDTYTILAYLI